MNFNLRRVGNYYLLVYIKAEDVECMNYVEAANLACELIMAAARIFAVVGREEDANKCLEIAAGQYKDRDSMG